MNDLKNQSKHIKFKIIKTPAEDFVVGLGLPQLHLPILLFMGACMSEEPRNRSRQNVKFVTKYVEEEMEKRRSLVSSSTNPD